MIFIIGSSIILLLPVIVYLLQPLSNQKSLIFLVTILVFGGFVLNFISKEPLIGSWVKATQSESILMTISRDEEFDKFFLNEYIFDQSSEEQSFIMGSQVFYKALEEQSFNTAESILKYLNVEFASENFQVPIFNLLADFRDEKYPEIANSNLIINVENPANCTLQLVQLGVSIPNGPGVNIASVELLSPNITRPIKLDKSNSTVRGFDIASAFMQQEIIKIEALAECDKFIYEAFKTIDLKYSQDNQEELFFYTDEWLKREQ